MQLVTGSKLAGNGLPRLEWAEPQRAEFRPGTQVENMITAVGSFSPLSILPRLCLFLCLALTALLVTATRSEAALSAACQSINSDWGGSGRTLTSEDPNNPLHGPSSSSGKYSGFNLNESLSWTFNGTDSGDANIFVSYWIAIPDDNAADGEYVGQTPATDQTGSHTFTSFPNGNGVYIELGNGNNNISGATGTLAVTCSAGATASITLTPAAGALTAGQVGTAYSQSVSASGGTGPYTYALTGSLPAGLSLNTSTGEISGTPTTVENPNFTITATDANNATGDAAYSLQINAAPVTITLSPAAGALTAGQVGTAYSQSVSASGGTGPYTYALTGSLPAGLSLNTSTGEISGTPTTVENPNFTITATDANNATGNAAYSLQINAAPVTITLSPAAGALTAGQVGTAYSQSVSASGGTGPYTYALTGSLPAGLSLNTSTGEISGTPTTVENPNFTITATDANNATGNAAYSLQINAAPVTVTLSPAAGALTAGQVGTAYSQSVSASGGTGPYTYALTGSLPAGLSLNTSTGEISGTPTTVENPNFTITATDANNATGNAAYSLQINAAPVTITLSPAAGALTAGQVGTAYSQSVSASGGTGPYTYALTGSLPAGLSLNTSTGEISGTPTTVENPNFTITATDANNATGNAAYSLQINAAPVTITLSPAAGALTAGQVGTAYSQSVSASGGTGPYTYALTGSLPAGLSLNTSTGEISGTPTTVENPNFTITATDANNATGNAAYSLQINAAPVTITLSPAAGALTAGQVGTAYSQSVSASGGTGPYTYALTGSLPAGLSLNTSTGEISGTPTTVENPNFTITATDANNATGNAAYSLQINAAPVTVTLSPAAGALTAGQVGTAYSQSVSASGGTGPYTYALTGSLPAGLSLNTSTGEISGTPTTAGTATFTVTATDANNNTGDAAYSLNVNAAPASISFEPAGGALPEAMAGEEYTTTIAVSGGSGPYLFSVSAGALPPGMVLNVSTGALNGPLNTGTEGSYSFAIQVSDANNAVASAAYTLEVKKRAVTVTDKVVTVPAGSTPTNVNLATGATGGPFIDANIVSVEPANAGTARIVNSQFAQAGGVSGSAGFYLTFTPDPAYSGQVTIRFSLTSELGISNTGSVIYNLGYNPQKVAAEIDSLVRGFVRTRQGLIANSVKVPGLRDRRRMQTANEIVSMRFTPSQRGVSLGFATSLEQMRAASNALTPDLKAEPLAFNVWIRGSASAHTRKQNDGRWGSFAMLSAGADYLLADWALLGVSFHYDRMSDPTPDGARLSGNGWLAGPYASIEVYRNVFWDTRLFLGGSSNDIDTEFWDGTFDTTRWMADTALSGEWNLDAATTLSPTLRAVYLSEKVKDYGVRNGAGDQILMDGFIEEQFRVSGALELARLFILDNGLLLTPALELTGGYAGLGGKGAFGAAEGSLMLTDGFSWRLNAGVKVNVEGDGSTSLTARAGAGIRF